MKNTLTDEQIMNAVCTAADALDATRVSELRVGGWHATTIFDGDSGLLRLGRLIEKAVQSTRPEARQHDPVALHLKEREAFEAWWASRGEHKFSETPHMAAGAAWFARSDMNSGGDK